MPSQDPPRRVLTHSLRGCTFLEPGRWEQTAFPFPTLRVWRKYSREIRKTLQVKHTWTPAHLAVYRRSLCRDWGGDPTECFKMTRRDSCHGGADKTNQAANAIFFGRQNESHLSLFYVAPLRTVLIKAHFFEYSCSIRPSLCLEIGIIIHMFLAYWFSCWQCVV